MGRRASPAFRAEGGGVEHELHHVMDEFVEQGAPSVTTAVAAVPYLTRFAGVEDSGFADTRRYGFGPVVGVYRSQEPPLVRLIMAIVNARFGNIRGTWDAVIDSMTTLPVTVVENTGRGVQLLSAPHRVHIGGGVELSDVQRTSATRSTTSAVRATHQVLGCLADERHALPPAEGVERLYRDIFGWVQFE